MNKEIETRIGRNIRRLREEAGMTQDTLAAKLQVNGCDVTRSALAKIEVGQRHLYPDEIMLIKQILRVEYEDLRHHIDHPILGLWGGHMGYTVRPSERGKGYAKEMLRLNIQNAKAMGIEKLLVTCDVNNKASEKTILANGGVYENTIDVDGSQMKRYWIEI